MQGVPTTVSVSSAFLQKCMNDPEKAKYLEENLAAIPDCAKSAVNGCLGTLTNLSYKVDENGNISVAISGTNDPDGKIAKENAERKVKENREKEEKVKEKRAAKKAEEEKAASNVTTSTVELKTSRPGVTKTEQIKTGYSNVNDYSKYLQGKYHYMNTGTTSMQGVPTTVSVSSAFLQKCMNDPEKAKYLEENLAAIPDCAKSADRKSTRLNSSHNNQSRMPSSA